MSPASRRLPPDTVIEPFDTRSPVMFRVPLPLTASAVPLAPPQPAWFSVATAGVYSWLFTLPVEVAARVGLVPLVRMRANCRSRVRLAPVLNWLPRAPSAFTTRVTDVPSAYVH